MPCQCNTTAVLAADTINASCECASAPESTCGCGDTGAPTPSDRSSSLERVVMELDKRVRALEAPRV